MSCSVEDLNVAMLKGQGVGYIKSGEDPSAEPVMFCCSLLNPERLIKRTGWLNATSSRQAEHTHFLL